MKEGSDIGLMFEWEKNVFDAYSRLRLHVRDDESLERDVEVLAAECRQAWRLRRRNDDAAAENERLRAALRQIAEYDSDEAIFYVDIARAALDGKETK